MKLVLCGLIVLGLTAGSWYLTRLHPTPVTTHQAVLNGPCKALKIRCGDNRIVRNTEQAFRCPEIVVACEPVEEK